MCWALYYSPGPLARIGPPNVNEVVPGLLVGEFPRPEDIGWLREEHRVSAVFNLQDDEDLVAKGLDLAALQRAYELHGIRLRRYPIPDYEPSRLTEHLDDLLDEIEQALAAGQCVYLHCNAGMNRAPTVAIAYLHVHRGYSLAAACHALKSLRACAPYLRLLYAHFGEEPE
jgi:protein-tyrosine phosphatase